MVRIRQKELVHTPVLFEFLFHLITTRIRGKLWFGTQEVFKPYHGALSARLPTPWLPLGDVSLCHTQACLIPAPGYPPDSRLDLWGGVMNSSRPDRYLVHWRSNSRIAYNLYMEKKQKHTVPLPVLRSTPDKSEGTIPVCL